MRLSLQFSSIIFHRAQAGLLARVLKVYCVGSNPLFSSKLNVCIESEAGVEGEKRGAIVGIGLAAPVQTGARGGFLNE
jgi:propanediol dehydratase large subunit